MHHAERQLLDGVERILRGAATRQGWVLLVLHLSRFPPPGPRLHHRRVAASVLDDAAGRSSGQLFALANSDMALLFRPTDGGTALLAALARLFQADVADPSSLRSLWLLPGSGTAALAYIQTCLYVREPAGFAEEQRVSGSVIGLMDGLVQTAPVAELMHRQTAVILRPGQPQPIVPLFREVAISTAVLEARAAATGQVQTDQFLFSHLAVRLDRRMLGELTADVPGRGALSCGLGVAALHVNLTLAGILSEGFSAFAAACAAASSAGLRVAVELSYVEVFADVQSFVLARERLRLAGMALVLDGVAHPALLLSNPATLQPDLLKLNWSPALPACSAEMRQALQRLGLDRVVLHRAESEAALAWGMSQGIMRYQGRYVDQMLAAERMRACSFAAACTLRQCIDRAGASGPGARAACADLPLLDLGVPMRARTSSPPLAMAG